MRTARDRPASSAAMHVSEIKFLGYMSPSCQQVSSRHKEIRAGIRRIIRNPNLRMLLLLYVSASEPQSPI